MKVNIITERSEYECQREINDFIKHFHDSDILDIKYSHSMSISRGVINESYSAMIVYKEVM